MARRNILFAVVVLLLLILGVSFIVDVDVTESSRTTYIASLSKRLSTSVTQMVVVSDGDGAYLFRRTVCPEGRCVLDDVPQSATVSRVAMDFSDYIAIESVQVGAHLSTSWLRPYEAPSPAGLKRESRIHFEELPSQSPASTAGGGSVKATVVYSSSPGRDVKAGIEIVGMANDHWSILDSVYYKVWEPPHAGDKLEASASVDSTEAQFLTGGAYRSWTDGELERSASLSIPVTSWVPAAQGVTLTLSDEDFPDELRSLSIDPVERRVWVTGEQEGCFGRRFVGYQVVWDRHLDGLSELGMLGGRVRWTWMGAYGSVVSLPKLDPLTERVIEDLESGDNPSERIEARAWSHHRMGPRGLHLVSPPFVEPACVADSAHGRLHEPWPYWW